MLLSRLGTSVTAGTRKTSPRRLGKSASPAPWGSLPTSPWASWSCPWVATVFGKRWGDSDIGGVSSYDGRYPLLQRGTLSFGCWRTFFFYGKQADGCTYGTGNTPIITPICCNGQDVWVAPLGRVADCKSDTMDMYLAGGRHFSMVDAVAMYMYIYIYFVCIYFFLNIWKKSNEQRTVSHKNEEVARKGWINQSPYRAVGYSSRRR